MRPRLAARGTFLSLLVFGLSPLVFGLSCQSAPDISGVIDTYGELFNISVVERCKCPQDLGYETIQECDDALGVADNDARACMVGALEGKEEDAQAYFECANEALGAFVTCLEDNAGCVEGWNEDCTSDHESARAECSGLSAAQLGDIEACIS